MTEASADLRTLCLMIIQCVTEGIRNETGMAYLMALLYKLPGNPRRKFQDSRSSKQVLKARSIECSSEINSISVVLSFTF
jgi:hypothetical protein